MIIFRRFSLFTFLLIATAIGTNVTSAQTSEPQAAASDENDGKLRIICFGAHPDDAEYKSGGTASRWAAQGHHVKLVSVTNGEVVWR